MLHTNHVGPATPSHTAFSFLCTGKGEVHKKFLGLEGVIYAWHRLPRRSVTFVCRCRHSAILFDRNNRNTPFCIFLLYPPTKHLV